MLEDPRLAWLYYSRQWLRERDWIGVANTDGTLTAHRVDAETQFTVHAELTMVRVCGRGQPGMWVSQRRWVRQRLNVKVRDNRHLYVFNWLWYSQMWGRARYSQFIRVAGDHRRDGYYLPMDAPGQLRIHRKLTTGNWDLPGPTRGRMVKVRIPCGVHLKSL